jgi:DNA-binding transcriptional MerR regulator
MKIGKFSEIHNITRDTVRHYLDLGLLVAEKKGGHYNFSDADCRDIKKIIELKNLGFSLNAAQKIMAMQRISGENTNSFRNLYMSLLEDKKKEVENDILSLNKLSYSIKEKIYEIKCQQNEDVQKLGFALSSLHLLECPQCNSQLNISAGIIEKNNIIDANIQCACGFTAEIKDGIYIDKRSVRAKLYNGERMPSKEEYLAATTHSYSNFLYKGIAALIESINQCSGQPQYIVELDNCVGFFLMQYIKYLPEDSTYILIDYDYERLTNAKRDLENYYKHKNFIFLCCDYENLPLKDSSFDMIIDYMMAKTYEESKGIKLFDVVLPKLKADGTICGVYLYSEEISKTGKKVDTENSYNKGRMMKFLENYHITLTNSSIIGPLTEGKSYHRDVGGRNNYQGIYIGNIDMQ